MPIFPPDPNVTEVGRPVVDGRPSENHPFLSRTTGPYASLTDGRTLPKAEWETMLDNGQIINRNPPPSPQVVANREANDALFRSFQANRVRGW